MVVSGGAFGSPAILERSGIGAKTVLEKYGIQQLVDLPGVGENYQGLSWYRPTLLKRASQFFFADHQVIFAPYLASEESETIDGIVRNEDAHFNSKSCARNASVRVADNA